MMKFFNFKKKILLISILILPLALVIFQKRKWFFQPPLLTKYQVVMDVQAMLPVKDFFSIESGFKKKNDGAVLEKFIDYQPHIISIDGPVDGYTIVALDPPFREFPNILVYHFDESEKRWKRIKEGVSFGIQIPSDELLNLHTIGLAVDLTDNDLNQLFSFLKEKKGYSIIKYDYFIHTHTAGKEQYHIDKTNIQLLARKIMGAPYNLKDKSEFIDTCELYDLPKLDSISFKKEGDYFLLVGQTNNHQKWALTFRGADEERLLEKSLTANRIE